MTTTIRTAGSLDLPSDAASRSKGRVAALVLAPLDLLVWLVAGWGSVDLLDSFRLMLAADISQWGSGGMPGVGLGAFFVGVFLGSLTGFATLRAIMRATGAFGPGFAFTNAIALAGIGGGQLAAIGQWTPIPDPGTVLEVGSTTMPGDVGAWIGYQAPLLVPAVLAVLAVCNLVPGIAGTVKAARRVALGDELRTHGRRVLGRIVDASFTNVWIMGMPRFRVTAEYDTGEGLGTVTTHMTTDAMRAPMVGGPIEVLHDPRSPRDPRRIELTLPANGPTHPGAAMFLPRD